MADLRMIETGDGGDVVLQGNDFVVIGGLQNMPYIGLWGGNLEASTKGAKEPNQQALDWWGNHLLMENNESTQFNSELERLLDNIVLNASGRLEIESVIKKDLKFMEAFSIVDVEVQLINVDRIQINIKITEPDNLGSNEFSYIWDATNGELSGSNTDAESTAGAGIALDNMLNFEL